MYQCVNHIFVNTLLTPQTKLRFNSWSLQFRLCIHHPENTPMKNTSAWIKWALDNQTTVLVASLVQNTTVFSVIHDNGTEEKKMKK